MEEKSQEIIQTMNTNKQNKKGGYIDDLVKTKNKNLKIYIFFNDNLF